MLYSKLEKRRWKTMEQKCETEIDYLLIENLIKDYHWMIKEVDRLERSLYSSRGQERSWGVAQYGIEASLPKGSSGISLIEVEALDNKEERIRKRIKKYEVKIKAIEAAVEMIEGDMHIAVYDCMLEGMSYRAIAEHLGISRDKVRQIKNEIINQLSQNNQIRQLLNL
jgi:DNA-directed RNA polymerase specialized sigma24 family protein